jgi:2,4-dienoyl-CoA reductase-like NADH-dependent reductase (Old Yellow Enzyme family)
MTGQGATGSGDVTGILDAFSEPFAVDGLRTANRWVMAPMTRRASPDGVPTSAVADYYTRRAAGGIGLILTEGVYLDLPTAGHDSNVPRLVGDTAQSAWSEIVSRVHGEGSAILAQLWHLGPQIGEQPHDGAPVPTATSPSGIHPDGSRCGPPMTVRQIDDVVDAYVRAATTAQQIGFDGVEIHGAHGYLIDSFLWATTNARTDRYGGTTSARARFAAEVVAAIRSECPTLAISFRFSQWKVGHYDARVAATPHELEQLLMPVAEAGATLFHASTRRFWEPAFPDSELSLAGWAKRLTGRPAIAVGSIGLDTALQVGHDHARASLDRLADLSDRVLTGEFDLAAVGRAAIANPDWDEALRAGSLRPYTPAMRAHLV